jgi:2'-hydroxyisoflavone reductase
MDILILGGPQFLGRATIEAALAAGHTITLFNRGQTQPDLYPQVEKLRGDRDGNLNALKGKNWDAVIDHSGFFPRVVRQSAELLADHVGHYIFISSFAAYREMMDSVLEQKNCAQPGITEDAPLVTLQDETSESMAGDGYGGFKVLCERVVQEVYPNRALILRPGNIVGPFDPRQVLTYWVRRVAQGGDMLAPTGPEYHEQFIDVRDQAEWTIRMVEACATGIYNVTGPAVPLTLGQILETARDVTQSIANLIWVRDDFLIKHNVLPWHELPMWLPSGTGWSQVSIARALAAGLTFRPLVDTVRDTLAWAQRHPQPHPDHLTREREAELLRAWRGRLG